MEYPKKAIPRIAINGFGRIGRVFFRQAFHHPDLSIEAINDLADPATLGHLLQYDSVHGRFNHTVTSNEATLFVDGKPIRILKEKDPAALPWKEMGIDLVVESTGRLTDRASAEKHLTAGAGKVIISAPAKDPDVTLVLGVNEAQYQPNHHRIVSNASCTTHCLAPTAHILMKNFGIKRGLMTTIHSYTNDQQLLDLPHKDLRRGRAAGLSMIPTTTGAARALSEVLPALKGRLDGMSIRVPTPNVSMIDLVVETERDVTEAEIRNVFMEVSQKELFGILDYTEAPLVSIDLTGNSHSAIIDGTLTNVVGKRLAKVIAWYDNEWAYSNRLLDLIFFMFGIPPTYARAPLKKS